MIAALIIFGLIATIALLIPVSFEIIAFAHNYRIFQKRDDDFFDYATIDYSTLKRLYQINPNGYELSSFGQLYRINHSHGLPLMMKLYIPISSVWKTLKCLMLKQEKNFKTEV